MRTINSEISRMTPGQPGRRRAAKFHFSAISLRCQRSSGQPVVVDNRASALVAAEVESKAPPDGYTLNVGGDSIWTTGLLRKVAYDAVRDLAPITMTEKTVYVLAVHPSLPVDSIKALIALAKPRPGELNYASASIGGASHLGMELFKTLARVNVVHIPYKGSASSITAMISGEVQIFITDTGLVAPHVKTGKLRVLAITAIEPSMLVPGVPTVAASGLPGYELLGRTGVWAPAKTPAAIINRLNQEIVRVLNTPTVKEKFLNAGVEVVGSSPGEFAGTIKSEIEKIGKVIKDAGRSGSNMG